MKSYDILKTHCKKIFLSGTGNFWYEEDAIGDDKSTLYRICSFFLFFVYCFMTILEILAVVMGDFPKAEKSDCMTFAFSHTMVLIKISLVCSNKDLIKSLNLKMVTVCEKYEEKALMAQKYKTIKTNLTAYFVIVYGTALFFVFDGLRKMREGSHFVTVVTYYPSYDNNSALATAVRISTTVILMMMMVNMIISVDSFIMIYLIMFKYKFITLRHYFENLRMEFDRILESEDKNQASETLYNGLRDGIVMHAELLRISKYIDCAFGIVLALQLGLSSGSTVTLLLQIAISKDLTFVARMKIIFFVVGLFFLLALFLCNAGEITYQASLLSDSIFYCGWHACSVQKPSQRNPRRLVLQACAQAQRPLAMKAFKMVQLTYSTFLQVVRLTYSVFALFYAQNT